MLLTLKKLQETNSIHLTFCNLIKIQLFATLLIGFSLGRAIKPCTSPAPPTLNVNQISHPPIPTLHAPANYQIKFSFIIRDLSKTSIQLARCLIMFKLHFTIINRWIISCKPTNFNFHFAICYIAIATEISSTHHTPLITTWPRKYAFGDEISLIYLFLPQLHSHFSMLSIQRNGNRANFTICIKFVSCHLVQGSIE